MSTQGLARPLTRTLLSENLGPEVAITFPARGDGHDDRRVAFWPRMPRRVAATASSIWRTGAARPRGKRQSYGMHALKSYRPNDPARPTICLVHGLNSSSGGFVHMIPWLEEAATASWSTTTRSTAPRESCAAFARDWAAFRREAEDRLPWSIVAHSMGALLARSLVEDDATWARDVSSLILIAPVNQGSHLAKVQTMHPDS